VDNGDRLLASPAAKNAAKKATLNNCHLLMFAHVHEGDERIHDIVTWRGEPANIKPIESGKRLRDLRPGDAVIVFVFDRAATLVGVKIYR